MTRPGISGLLSGFAILLSGCAGPLIKLGIPEDIPLEVAFLPCNDTSVIFVSPASMFPDTKWNYQTGNGSPGDPVRCTLVLTNHSRIPWEGNIRVTLRVDGDSARFFLPGFMYGRNRGEHTLPPGLIKRYPRLGKTSGNPADSPYWYMRSDQLTHPVAAMYSNSFFYGISGKPFEMAEDSSVSYHGFYCSLEKGSAIGYTTGYLEAPGLFVSPWNYEKYSGIEKEVIRIEPGSIKQIPLTIYHFPAEGECDLGEILKDVYSVYHEMVDTRTDPDAALKLITNAISRDAYDPGTNTYALISKKPLENMADNSDGGGVRYALNNLPGDQYDRFLEGLISWTNGTVIAVPLLEAGLHTARPELREQALRIIDDIVRHNLNPATGIPFCTKQDGKWSNRGWWATWVESEQVNPGHSSYIIGQAIYYILYAYDMEQAKAGVTHHEWLQFSESVLSTLSDSQLSSGAFPRFWDEVDGHGSQYEAFSGCWVAAAMALHEQITGKSTFADASRRAEAWYTKDVKRMECYYTPLDVADAPDSEGVLSYIRLARTLHEITGEQRYLDDLIHGLDYSFSFKFCYNVPVTEAPLDKTGWQSSGGDITSVCNAVIHCMSNSILGEIHYAYEKTGEPYYRERLRDTYLWGMQAFNRTPNAFFFGKEGWSTEYFCQSNRYVLDIRLENGTRSNIWFAYHPWATAAVLEGMLDVMNDSLKVPVLQDLQ